MEDKTKKLTEADIKKMKRPQLEALIEANKLDIQVKVGMTNAQLADAIIEKLGDKIGDAILPNDENNGSGDKEEKTDSFKASADQRKRAREIASQYNVPKVYINDKGEFFVSECNALNSVGKDITKLETVKIN